MRLGVECVSLGTYLCIPPYGGPGTDTLAGPYQPPKLAIAIVVCATAHRASTCTVRRTYRHTARICTYRYPAHPQDPSTNASLHGTVDLLLVCYACSTCDLRSSDPTMLSQDY